jgi:hypothetical protein
MAIGAVFLDYSADPTLSFRSRLRQKQRRQQALPAPTDAEHALGQHRLSFAVSGTSLKRQSRGETSRRAGAFPTSRRTSSPAFTRPMPSSLPGTDRSMPGRPAMIVSGPNCIGS